MSDSRQKVETVTKFPEGDLYNNYDPNDNPEKFEYLKAKYVFRFPFTITSIKWGLALGSIFGIHNYIKTRKAQNAAYWFVWGSVLTALPIWGFFMFKYSFYTMTLRKFEVDQYQNIEDSHLIKEYMMYKTGTYDPTIKDEQLVKKLEKISQQAYKKHSQLDDLLQNMNDEEFELVPVQKADSVQTDNNINNNLESTNTSKLQKQ
ncbi:transmembrane protein, putative (macronuclear) [Tetrahymena thermophila SB210]|uniref:Transmembrane protein, putative n=1 Tax=Tetrahymena thermophila (strain SB210) TaxID=312017 RepID=I7MLJ5_TETTS|nr:transmembrane protein, putative [Tetrahymena thermophila SB210]EAS02414.2 transmembrane protein, putative [Tetrahymena thermophila SB210]|eukprot:XP_001022659.2 transmembrane protein, putative [Tetrahymena thermophila SB210]